MSTETKSYSIVNGPPKNALADMWEYTFVEGANIPIEKFVLEKDHTLSCIDAEIDRITMLKYPTGSNGVSIELQGRCKVTGIKCFEPSTAETLFGFFAAYNPTKREGTIWLVA